jgi:hypothetical protein
LIKSPDPYRVKAGNTELNIVCIISDIKADS